MIKTTGLKKERLTATFDISPCIWVSVWVTQETRNPLWSELVLLLKVRLVAETAAEEGAMLASASCCLWTQKNEWQITDKHL